MELVDFLLLLLFYRVNESGKDPGFGQSILHDCQLIFHTPPYNIGSGVVIHDHPVPQWPNIRFVNKVKKMSLSVSNMVKRLRFICIIFINLVLILEFC